MLDALNHFSFQITGKSIEVIREENIDLSKSYPIDTFVVRQCWDAYCQQMSPIKRFKPIHLALLSNYGISTTIANILTTPTHREAILNWIRLNEGNLNVEQFSLKNKFIMFCFRINAFIKRKFSRSFLHD